MQIRDSLTKRAREFNILVDDVAITHLSFGTEVCTLCKPVNVDTQREPILSAAYKNVMAGMHADAGFAAIFI